jgi:hypothetical protein
MNRGVKSLEHVLNEHVFKESSDFFTNMLQRAPGVFPSARGVILAVPRPCRRRHLWCTNAPKVRGAGIEMQVECHRA